MNEEYKKELAEILDWAIKEEDKIYRNSKVNGLDGHKEEHKKIKEEMMKKVEKLNKKYSL